MDSTKYIGMDVHKESISIAILRDAEALDPSQLPEDAHTRDFIKVLLGVQCIVEERERIYGTSPPSAEQVAEKIRVAQEIDHKTGGRSMEVAITDPQRWRELSARLRAKDARS